MSASLHTTNLNLPYFSETDFTDWETYNNAMQLIDEFAGKEEENQTSLQTNVTNNTNAIAELNKTVEALNNSSSANNKDITALNKNVTALENTVNTQGQNITSVMNDVESLTTAVGNIPSNLEDEITALQTKNTQQDTAIAAAQSEANTATQTANQAIVNTSKFDNSQTITNLVLNSSVLGGLTLTPANLSLFVMGTTVQRLNGKINVTVNSDSGYIPNRQQFDMSFTPSGSSVPIQNIAQSATILFHMQSSEGTTQTFINPAYVEYYENNIRVSTWLPAGYTGNTFKSWEIYI